MKLARLSERYVRSICSSIEVAFPTVRLSVRLSVCNTLELWIGLNRGFYRIYLYTWQDRDLAQLWKKTVRKYSKLFSSIEWCHFQWPWMTHNPDFKGTPLFDVNFFWVLKPNLVQSRICMKDKLVCKILRKSCI